MKLQKILAFSHSLLKSSVSLGDTVIDATVGNGHDTVFLAQLVGANGQVFGFDVQKQAVENTKRRIEENHLSHCVTLYNKGHETVKESIPIGFHQKITGAIFNLGFLPGGNKTIITQPHTTIAAIEQLLDIMAPEGILVLVVYHGHPGGKTERSQLEEYVVHLDQEKAHVLKYEFINQKNNPPYIIAIEKR